MRPDLPTGTVTFLFTDVEGSTRLLEEIGDEAYEEALSGHGGQIVLSEATAELVAGSLTDLGVHRLKDVEHAVAFPLRRGSE